MAPEDHWKGLKLSGPVTSLECEGFREGSTSWQASQGNPQEQAVIPWVAFIAGRAVHEHSSPQSPRHRHGVFSLPTALHLFSKPILPCTMASSEALRSALLRINLAENHRFLLTYSSSRACSCALQLVPLWAVRWGAQIPSGGPHLRSV